MENVSKFLWGIVLIILGVIIGLNALDVTNIDIFFQGWWTLFIIIPCFIGLISNREKVGNTIGLLIGVSLLLASWDIIDFSIIAKLVFPFILVIIGLSLIFNETWKKKVTKKVKMNTKEGVEAITSTFSDQKIKKENEEFKGAIIDAVFGGVTLDLRGAKIKEETSIKASAIFGGITIIIPKDVNVITKSTPIFGGVSNKTINAKENKKTIYIDATSIFGGIDIK